MRRHVWLIAILVLAATLLQAGVLAQRDRTWFQPYERAVKAYDAGRYQDAINEMLQAVKMGGARSARNKTYEGVNTADYFPYVYLGLAYARLNQLELAKQYLDKALSEKPPNQYALLASNGLKDVLASAKPAAPTAAAPAPTTTAAAPTSAPSAPARNPAFDAGLKQLEGLLTARSYDGALKQFDTLRNLDAAAYARENLQERRNQAAGLWAQQLADEGSRLLQDEKLNEAKTRFQDAARIVSGHKAALNGIVEIQKRETDYQTLKASAAQDAGANNFAGARDKYQLAQKAHPELFAGENLGAQLNAVVAKLSAAATPASPATVTAAIAPASLTQFDNGRKLESQGNYSAAAAAYTQAVKADKNNLQASEALKKLGTFADLVTQARGANKRGDVGGAIQRLQDAKALDPTRFDREKLVAELDTLIASGGAGDTEGKALREALLALLRGDAKGSSDVLEPLVVKPGNPQSPRLIDLQAYLGVAYATRALTATKDEEQQQLREKAMQYFRQAVAANRNYKLSARLVSPRIVAMFDQAK